MTAPTYLKCSIGTGLVTAIVCYLYAIATYGLLGGIFGWLPSFIIGCLVGAMWPLLLFVGTMGGMISLIVVLLHAPH